MKSSETINPDSHAGCDGCPLIPERREFLRNAAVFAVAAMSLGLPLRRVSAQIFSSAGDGRKSLSYPVPSQDGAQIDRDNDVILVRYQNEVIAFSLGCPHQNVALRWSESEMRFQCPKHHSQYEPGGEFIKGRATRNMDRLAIKRDGSNIVVDPDTLYRNDEEAAQWNAAVVRLA